MNSFPYDYEEEYADEIYADIYNDDEIPYGEFVKAGRMAELINQPEGNTKMATEFDPTTMTLDEIQAAVEAGELDLVDVKFTDEQAAEAESQAHISLAELHAALNAIFDGMPDRDVNGTEVKPADLLYSHILDVIAQNREIEAIFEILGINPDSAKLIFGGSDEAEGFGFAFPGFGELPEA